MRCDRPREILKGLVCLMYKQCCLRHRPSTLFLIEILFETEYFMYNYHQNCLARLLQIRRVLYFWGGCNNGILSYIDYT